MNNVSLMGRLTSDITLRYTGSQVAVTRFTLAVDRGKDKDGNRLADFINCLAFGKTAEFLEKYVGKGCRVSLVGHIQTGSYDKDGTKVYTTDIIADKAEPIDWKDSKKDSDIPEGFAALEDDSLPF